MTYDVIIIGIGLSGLTAGLRLAQTGKRVLLLAKGVGGTHLDGGTIDVLGYAGARVTNPAQALVEFLIARPRHPYTYAQNETALALDWFSRVMNDAGYPFAGNVDENFLLPSAIGVARPTAFVPQTMMNGDLRAGGNFLIIGFRNLKDFYADLCAENLNRAAIENLRARSITIAPPELEGADVSPLDFARAFERESFRAQFAKLLHPQIQKGEIVGLPALLGLNDPVSVWRDLEQRLNVRVFEIPLLPPSIPGIRIFDRMTNALRSSGARIQMGFHVIDAETKANRVISVSTASATHPQIWRVQEFILATGGIASGGIVVESDGRVHESVFDLPIANVPPKDGNRFRPNYFDSHQFSKIGIRVDNKFRPLGANGEPVFENLRAVGGVLAEAEPWKEKSGEGIAVATGFAAAVSVIEKD